MFVIPVVASSSITCVSFVDVFFLVDMSSGPLQHCRLYSVTNSMMTFYDIYCIYQICIHTSIYIFICENDTL